MDTSATYVKTNTEEAKRERIFSLRNMKFRNHLQGEYNKSHNVRLM